MVQPVQQRPVVGDRGSPQPRHLVGTREAMASGEEQLRQRDVVRLAQQHEIAEFAASDQFHRTQLLEEAVDLLVGQRRLIARQRRPRQRDAGARGARDPAQHAQQAGELESRPDAGARVVEAEGADRRRDRRAEQHDQPQQVHPQQEDRDHRERAEDLLVAGPRQVLGETALGQLEQHRGDRCADGGVAQAHDRRRDHRVGQPQGDPGDHDRQPAEQALAEVVLPLGLVDHRQGEQVGGEAEVGRDQHRAEGQDGPVDDEARDPVAARAGTKIRLKVSSMPDISSRAETTSAMTPTVVSW